MDPKITIKNNLEIENINKELTQYLKDMLTTTNPEWLEAKNFGRWLKNTPQFIKQYQEVEDKLIIPRGLLSHLLEDLDINWLIEDLRVSPEPEEQWPEGIITLRPGDQEPAVNKLIVHENGFLVGPAGCGKALSLDTAILTTSGWKTMSSIEVGDFVFSEYGDPIKVTYVSPIQYRTSFRLEFDACQTVIACQDHLWETSTYKEREKGFVRKNPRKACEKKGLPPEKSVKTTKEIANTLYGPGDRINHSIVKAAALKFPEQQLPIPPYTLGVWLGDGSSRFAQIFTADKEIVSFLKEDGFILTKIKTDPYGWKIQSPNSSQQPGNCWKQGGWPEHNLKTILRKQDLILNKHIPKIYKLSSYEQRLKLIQGLMDTDGTINSNGRCEFSVTKKTLAQDFLEVLRSLGIKANLCENDAKIKGRFISKRYRISFTPRIKVFRLSRKRVKLCQKPERQTQQRHYIKKATCVGVQPVRCIAVDNPSSLYLITKSLIPTHNTVLGLEACRRLGLKALWLTHRKELKDQAIDTAVELLEIPKEDIGELHGKTWTIGKQLTVGMIPTLRKRDLKDLADSFGVVVIDEAHHVPSSTFLQVIDKFNSLYVYGLTATAYRRDNLEGIMFNAIGPKVAEIKHEELFEDEHLMLPHIKKINTGWCPANYDKMNYHDFMESMVTSRYRNELIIKDIVTECQNKNNTSVVLVERTKHAQIITELLKDKGIKSEFVVSSVDVEIEESQKKKSSKKYKKKKKIIPKKIRDQVVSDFKEGKIQVLVATYDLLAEGFNYKPLNRLFMVTPIRWRGLVIQTIGRVQRPSENKKEAIVYDYIDEKILMFAKQADSRYERVYKPMGMPIINY